MTTTITTTEATGTGGLAVRVLGVEVLDEIRAILREPTALFFSVIMPVGFFVLFSSLFGTEPGIGGIPVPVAMLATFGAFGVLSVTLLNPGISVAEDRTRGWLRVKKVSPIPVGTTLLAKIVATLPYSVAALLAMTATAVLVSGASIEIGLWLRLAGVLVLGSLPFALVGLAVGFQASGNATAAILNAVFFPSVIASGLWMPLEVLPAWVSDLAPWLPPYHLAQLALAQLTGAGGLDHLLALLVTTAVAGVLAALSYRSLRV